MAFRIVWLLPLLVAVSSSPLYSRSLVQTPTSSSEQYLLISPELQNSAYRIQPELIKPLAEFDFPRDQAVYYYPQPAEQQETLNLYELRQEEEESNPIVLWFQQFWNPPKPVESPEMPVESPEKPVESPVPTPESLPENVASPIEIPESLPENVASPIEIPESLPENSGSPVEIPESLPENIGSSILFDEMQKIPPIDKDAEVFSNELAKTLASQPIAAPAAAEPQAPQIYMHNEKYYVINGQPEFYGNFNALRKPVSPIFSLQQLAPIIRSEEKDEIKPKLISPFPLSLLKSFPKSALSDEAAPQLRSQAPASEQNQVTEPEKEQPKENSRREEEEEKSDNKEEVLSAKKGREISDESSVAQAKPNGIAIAGLGGVASSRPVANAISGMNGLSIASPVATAVAGDFLSEDYEDKKTE